MKRPSIISLVLLAVLLLTAMPRRVSAASAAASVLPAQVQFTLVTSGLTAPDFITNAGDGSNRLFILEQTGIIRVFKNGSLLATPFLTLGGLVSNFTGGSGEQGLLGLAFDPNYSSSGIFYITYTTTTGNATFPYTTTLARYRVSSGNADVADPASGEVLLSIPKKYTNHNGGMLAFGPDGYLYMSMGDGGSGGDPDNNAQNLHTLLGKLLRLDVTSTPPSGQKYAIPSSNPFYSSSDPAVKKEIWAYGLRNPWRFSFDRSNGNLYIGDVGQNIEEEVDFQAAASAGGQNYGWHILEGNLCYTPSTNCVAPTAYVPPVATYDHGTNDSYGCSLTGGYVYRGSASPALQGVYLYGDFCSGRVFGLVRNANSSWTYGQIASTSYTISSFGQDEQGELYLADYYGGKIYHISSNSVTISGNAGVGGAVLSYMDGTARSVASDASGGYAFSVPHGWSGTVTPSKGYYTFSPPSRTYGSLTSAQSAQDYTATVVHIFSDLPVAGQEWMEAWIDAFYGAGITSGCGTNPLIYCPTSNVTRAEIAVFLLRARHGASYQPPAASHYFSDMPVKGKEWMEAWADEFYREGLTSGCGTNPLIYCPEQAVTRSEIAVFVLRASHAAGWQPPASTGIFSDVPVSGQQWMQPWIEEFYREGITSGCNASPLKYCPLSNATRAEMAVFVDRAFHLYH